MSFVKTVISGIHQTAKKVSKESKRSYLSNLLDIVWCGLYYGASPNNYYKFDFYRIGHKKRKTYVTNRISNKMIRLYNQNSHRPVFEDKASFGGITCEIDIKTGEVISDGGAYGHEQFENHPCTGVPFKGFVIPYWDDVLKMLDDIASRVPEVGYVGWDVAIAKDGPIVIEGNTSPGYTFFQIPQLLPDQIGTMDKYKPFL